MHRQAAILIVMVVLASGVALATINLVSELGIGRIMVAVTALSSYVTGVLSGKLEKSDA